MGITNAKRNKKKKEERWRGLRWIQYLTKMAAIYDKNTKSDQFKIIPNPQKKKEL